MHLLIRHDLPTRTNCSNFFIRLQATQQSCRAALSFYLAWQVILYQVVGQFLFFISQVGEILIYLAVNFARGAYLILNAEHTTYFLVPRALRAILIAPCVAPSNPLWYCKLF
jgi:hypothetical protein